MSATEVAREFSAVVNRIGAGEEIEVVRNDVPVVQTRPPSSGHRSWAEGHWPAKWCMAVLIDTAVLIDAERRGQALDEVIGDQERGISAITASELLHGVHRAEKSAIRARRSAFVEHVISAMEPLPITTAIARAHAAVWAELEKDGAPIGAHDLWIDCYFSPAPG